MEKKKQLGIHIEGSIFAEDEHVDIDHDVFLNEPQKSRHLSRI